MTQTQYAYDQTYQQYIVLKNNYQQRYSTGFVGLQKADLEQAISAFFEDKVVENYTRLEGFTNELAQVLATGKTVVVHLCGYCSPRTTTDYNAKLAERRISCVKNYFLGWQNKALQSYIQSGKLRFSELPLGETTAPKGINDDIKNERLSIFSPEAAAERRVEIERVTVEASR